MPNINLEKINACWKTKWSHLTWYCENSTEFFRPWIFMLYSYASYYQVKNMCLGMNVTYKWERNSLKLTSNLESHSLTPDFSEQPNQATLAEFPRRESTHITVYTKHIVAVNQPQDCYTLDYNLLSNTLNYLQRTWSFLQESDFCLANAAFKVKEGTPTRNLM